MADFDDDDVARLRVALGRISRLVDRNVSAGGMTRTQMSVLASVALRGPLGATELAEFEGLNPTMLSRVLAKLADAGLLEREPDPRDRRAVLVQVTDAGRDLHQQLRAERSKLLTDRLSRLPASKARQIVSALPAFEALAAELAKESAPK